jgi:superfamily II DNA/RNA helicase
MPADSSAAPEHDLTGTTFAGLGVPAPLADVLDDQGITAPFPVQAATLPDALAGRDILGRAQTGSGKTLGFSLPLVSRLAGGSTLAARPRGLVLVPTRELATQVTEVLKPLARAMGLRVATIYGGVSYGPQVNALQRRTDIVVATPGRLADLIGQGECDLSDVEITVIDEADQMADLGFLPVVRRLLETTPREGQRMLFSATLDAAVDVLARRFLHDPVLHSVDENSSPAEIEHHVLTVEPANRVAVIAALAGGEKRSLVFTRTKHGAERLAKQLTAAGIPAAELHGNLRQGARSRNLAAFTSGLARVMVATDIAARGIHIDGIDLVIHADPPAEHKAYVHRSGRTARGGADGVVVTLQTRAQARDVTAMMRKAGITPHAAVTVDADSDAVAEIAGPPAPRVSVSGKVSELVAPEDRLARNDGPGAGKPWEGRPRRDRNGDRGRGGKPRDDRFRDRGPRDLGHRGGSAGRGGAPGSGGATGRGASSGPAPRRDRDDRAARGERSERADQSPRFNRDDRPARDGRFARDERTPRFERDGRNYGDRQGRQDNPGDRGGNDWWPRDDRNRDSRDERPFRTARPQAGGGRPPAGGQQSRPRVERTDRPQSGGHFGGSAKRGGYSAGGHRRG